MKKLTFRGIPPAVWNILQEFADKIQVDVVQEVSWTELEHRYSSFNSEEEVTDQLRRIAFMVMCEQAKQNVTHHNMESVIERDIKGLTIRSKMVCVNLDMFETLLSRAFTAGRLYEKGDK